VDITNPIDTQTWDNLATPPGTSSAEEIQQLVPQGTAVVKAFNTTFAGTLVAGEVAGNQLDVLIAGDDEAAKQKVAQLVSDKRRVRVQEGARQCRRERERSIRRDLDPPADRVTLLDGRAGRLLARVRVAGAPHDVDFTPDGLILWATAERGRRFDLAIDTLGRQLWVTLNGSGQHRGARCVLPDGCSADPFSAVPRVISASPRAGRCVCLSAPDRK
jgi:hypothetical protein